MSGAVPAKIATNFTPSSSCHRPTARPKFYPMIRIAITEAAFEAITQTLPLGSVGYENEANERGERLIWLDRAVVGRLCAMRGPGEDYSAVILIAAAGLRAR
jgi:hypothetical protein